ncbi:glycosyltransferase, partial [Candidatus Woesearchaeota archaeon]|nr:glycosyltransferase [Candidatus Woesearchaeota archaeon]
SYMHKGYPGKWHTIYNGVNVDKYIFIKYIPDYAPLIFLGRIEKIKGCHIAIKMAKKTNKKLIIAGNISDKDYFEKEIKPFLNERIVYVGEVNDHQKNILLGKSSALLMPIEWDEPFGIVMAEALACGTPVIGLNRGSVPELVKNGVDGFICNDEKEMFDAINNIGLIDRKMSRKTCEENFSSEVIARNYLRLYNE